MSKQSEFSWGDDVHSNIQALISMDLSEMDKEKLLEHINTVIYPAIKTLDDVIHRLENSEQIYRLKSYQLQYEMKKRYHDFAHNGLNGHYFLNGMNSIPGAESDMWNNPSHTPFTLNELVDMIKIRLPEDTSITIKK